MSETPDRFEHRFAVRIWFEPATRTGGQWRGSVVHIASGQRLYFATVGDLADFIALRMKNPVNAMDRAQQS